MVSMQSHGSMAKTILVLLYVMVSTQTFTVEVDFDACLGVPVPRTPEIPVFAILADKHWVIHAGLGGHKYGPSKYTFFETQ
jgi:hypothetical protein